MADQVEELVAEILRRYSQPQWADEGIGPCETWTTERLAVHLALSLKEAPVREGWKLVPVEPTEAMLEAGVVWGVRATPKPWCPATWAAMLRAAPNPPQPSGEG